MERSRPKRIPSRWLVPGLGILLALSGILVAWALWGTFRNQEEQLVRSSQELLHSLAVQRLGLLASRRDQLLADARVMAQSPVVRGSVLPALRSSSPSEEDLAPLTHWLDLRRRVFRHRAARLLDPAGMTRLAVGEEGGLPRVLWEPVLVQVRQSRIPELFALSSSDGSVSILLGIPLLVGEDDVLSLAGYVVYLLDPISFLAGVRDPLPLPYGGATIRLFGALPEGWREILPGGTWGKGTPGEAGSLSGSAVLPEGSWKVETSVPRASVLRPLRERVRLLGSMLGLLVLSLGLLGAAAWSRRESLLYRRRYELEQERERLCSRLAALSSLTRDPLLFVDRETGRILEANGASEEAYGRSREDLLSCGLRDLEDPEASRPSTDPPEGLEESLHRRSDGTPFPVEVNRRRAVIDGKELDVLAVRDISERRRSERILRESEERCRRIVETSLEGVCALDGGFRVTLVNPRLCEMLGYPQEELLGREVGEFLFPEDREAQEARHEARRTGMRERYERRFRNRSGEEVWVQVSASPVTDEQGRFQGSFAMMTDLTSRIREEQARRSLEEQLLQAQKMESVGRLAGGVAHDFNNLLTGILGYTELARGLAAEPGGELDRDLEEVQRLGQRAADLTRQLLAFSRRQVLEPRVVDLNERIRETLKMLQRLLGEDIQIHFRPQEGIGRVRVDPGQFDQVLLNLAVNARDAMPDGGVLSLETREVEVREEVSHWRLEAPPGRYVLVAVSDTGQGMDEATRSRLFEPFFTTKPAGKGTGLGLSMVYGIVKQHGGHLWVYSEPGKGSTFKVFFPRVEEAEPTEAASSEAPQGDVAPLKGLVLLTEDEPAVRALVVRVLRALGLEVLEAGNAAEAESLFRPRASEVALLLTDVVLPDRNGRELADALRGIREDLRVLYMSGYNEDVVAHRGILDPGVRFLRKPFTSRELAEKVREALEA